MVVAAQKSGFSREFFLKTVALTKVGEYAFDSERKLMSAIYKPTTATVLPLGYSYILCKGAPEAVLGRCTHYMGANDDDMSSHSFTNSLMKTEQNPLTEQYVDFVSAQAEKMANAGLRVLGFAIRRVNDEEGIGIIKAKKDTESEKSLSFVGLIGLIDPPK